MINYDDFSKVELKIAKVIEASRVEGSDKLLKLILDAGDKNAEGLPVNRQILAGIGKSYDPESLIGRQIAIVANLEPKKFTIKNKISEEQIEEIILESNGMLLAASDDSMIALLNPDKEIKSGSEIG